MQLLKHILRGLLIGWNQGAAHGLDKCSLEAGLDTNQDGLAKGIEELLVN